MAVRWAAGEETLSTCNMDIFPLETLDETGLRSGASLDALHGCLDPTILSMFEDTPALDTRDLEDDTQATLLTALTEILDNVDDENLSPFDTLPESDLLSGQKGREHSPLRRLFCLSRSPPEKDAMFGRPRSSGKSMPAVQQRSDGEEEDDSLTPSPERLEFSSDGELLDCEGLPVALEPHGDDGLSVSLGDLVKHMHPYCMTISLEDEQGGQTLHEGGILLEVVDQGENGEPILAIPELHRPFAVKLDELVSRSEAADEADDRASDTSEHIVVDDDDDDDFVKPSVKGDDDKPCANVKDSMTVDDFKCRNTSKKKTKTSPRASLKKASNKKTSKKKRLKESKNTTNTTLFTKPKETTSQRETSKAASEPLLPPFSKDQPENPSEAEKSDATTSFAAPETEEDTTSAPEASPEPTPAAVSICEPPSSSPPPSVPPSSSAPPSSPPAAAAEPKPKALSLAEYRRLRQLKKPAPIAKPDDHSTKWPSLPETPRELPPIPCLPEPSPRDPRRPRPQAKEAETEVKPAWMPRGPCAPPTPEALLAPPAYMVKTSAAAIPKSPQTVPQAAPSPSSHQNTQESTKSDESCAAVSPQATTDEIKPTPDVSEDKPETKRPLNSPEPSPRPTDACDRGASSLADSVKAPNQTTPDKPEKPPTVNPPPPKSPTQELIEAFTSEMGIEAADLTSLLEQFEETQAKEEQCVPEVSGRAVAVGNSGSELSSEKTDVERTRVNDLSSTALTPPATPPHPMWKPLAPVSLLGKAKTTEPKSGLSKVIEIEAQPLPSAKARSRGPPPAAAPVAPDTAWQDHDYCLPDKGAAAEEAGKRWNVKQNSSITIKPIKQPATAALQKVQVSAVQPKHSATAPQPDLEKSSVLETPDASPTRDVGNKNSTCPKRGAFGRSYRQRTSSRTPSPRRRSVSRTGGRRSRRSPSPSSNSSESDSSRSRSRSYTPPNKRYRLRRSSRSSSSRSRSRSSSRSRSPSLSPPRQRRYSYSSSRSASWSRSRSRSRSRSCSRSRSRSPHWSRKRMVCSPSYRDVYDPNMKMNHEVKRRKEKAIEERRVVYVGRIRGTMTQSELKERFSYFGEIEECTLHFRDHGDNYGFVTYYNTNDAFMAIENGGKLRKPDELPFDLCFGGRRQFCQTTYADLDSSKEYDPLPPKNRTHALDFDTLLKQAQMNLKR